MIITFFITNTVLENIMQWRFKFLSDIELCFRFLSKEITEIKIKGGENKRMKVNTFFSGSSKCKLRDAWEIK